MYSCNNGPTHFLENDINLLCLITITKVLSPNIDALKIKFQIFLINPNKFIEYSVI